MTPLPWLCGLLLLAACAPADPPPPSESAADIPLSWQLDRRWAIGAVPLVVGYAVERP